MNANMADHLAEVLQDAVNELDWYGRREKNLAEKAEDGRTWAEHLANDITPILRVIEALHGRHYD